VQHAGVVERGRAYAGDRCDGVDEARFRVEAEHGAVLVANV